MKIYRDSKEVFLLVLLLIWNLAERPEMVQDMFAALVSIQSLYNSADGNLVEELTSHISTKHVVDPSPYVSVDGVVKAQKFCSEAGGIKTVEGLFAHTVYYKCMDGKEGTF